MKKDIEQKQNKGFMTNMSKVAVGAGVLLTSVASQAAVTAPDFTDSINDLGVVLGAAIGFSAVVWGGRKLLGFIG